MNRYFYDGPVMEFEKVVSDRWQASTYAVSEAKARSNLTYQYKRENGKDPRSKITLPGKIILGVLKGGN